MRERLRARLENVRQHQSIAVSEAGSPYLLLAVLAASTFAAGGVHHKALLVDISLCVLTAACSACTR
jgi:hypothetical protein